MITDVDYSIIHYVNVILHVTVSEMERPITGQNDTTP